MPDDFRVMKNVRTENLPLCKKYMSTKWCQHMHILHSPWMFTVFFQSSAQFVSCFGNSTIAGTSFLLSIKRRDDVMLAFFNLSKLCCFGNYQKNILNNFFLEIHVTHDIINSNIVLIISTLFRFSVLTFLNTLKSLGGHAKKLCNFPMLRSIEFCLASKRAMKWALWNCSGLSPILELYWR